MTALQEYGLGQRTACRTTGCARSVAKYRLRRTDDADLVGRIKAIAMERRRFGYRRIGLLLKGEGLAVNHKRLYRIYRNLGALTAPSAQARRSLRTGKRHRASDQTKRR